MRCTNLALCDARSVNEAMHSDREPVLRFLSERAAFLHLLKTKRLL